VTASQQIILVLWGQGFDEIAASIFVAELRRLGKRVRLVGLNSQHIAGQYGVTLLPDLPLGQALRTANRIRCIIVPAPLASLQQFSYDPRLAELLGIAMNHQALAVVAASPTESLHPQTNSLSQFAMLHLLPYPPNEELLSFVQGELVPRL
jgi:hypothetical protein